MTTLHPAPSTHPHPHAVRDAWVAIAVSPVLLVVAAVAALMLGGSGTSDLWVGGALLSVLALVAPTYALVESRAADRRADDGAGLVLAGSVLDWLLVVAVLALAVVSPIAVLVALTLSACVVLVAWGTGEERES